jgi:hypothetical protein
MLFKLVAVIYVMTNGVLSDEPVGRLTNAHQFDTQAQCEAYLDTPDFMPQKIALDMMLKAQDEALVPKFVCEPANRGDKV